MKLHQPLILGSILVTLPFINHANVGIPIIMLTFPLMGLALIPIIFIEALVYKSSLELKYKQAFVFSFSSNMLSTLIGIPLAWVLSIIFEIIFEIIATFLNLPFFWTFYSFLFHGLDPRLLPYAIITQLIFAFFVSVYFEYGVIKGLYLEKYGYIQKSKLKRSVWKANGLSYLILIVIFAIKTIMNFLGA